MRHWGKNGERMRGGREANGKESERCEAKEREKTKAKS